MWFDRSEIEPEFLSLFRKKYGSRKIDLLMAAGADALDFTQRFHDILLPGVPMVFFNVAEDALPDVGSNRILPESFCGSTSWNAGLGGAFAAGRAAHRRCERNIGL